MKILSTRLKSAPQTKTLTILLAGSVLLFAVVLYGWWSVVYTNPENVFKGMLEQNLRTDGFTRSIEIKENDLTQTQYSQIQSGATNAAVSRIDSTTTSGDRQVAEVLATPEADYVRYTELLYRDEEGVEQDTSAAENVWARQQSSGDLSQSYAQLTLFRTYFPMGSVAADEREAILRLAEQNTVYAVNYDTVERQTIDGRDVYTYEITVQLQPYTDYVKLFGNATGQATSVAGLDPAQSVGSEPVPLKVSVDIASRQLVQVTYLGSQEITETYAGYGIKNEVKIPEDFISTAELQQRLSPGQ